ncbi:MAG: hypothetical protein GXO73_08695, partial [Calditrichaeota bacterium]|nr:hypothetical protein [Calditrichota bacterium]
MKSTQPASTPRPRKQLVFFFLSLSFALSIPLISLARDIDLGESAQRRYPFRAELSKVLQLQANEHVMVTDLDRNGVSELVFHPARRYVRQHGPLQLALYTVVSEQAQMIQQEPILGPVVPTAVREMDVLDAPGNELVITYLRNNELRCRIWNYQRVIRRDYLLYRRHTISDSVWDATATPVAVLDANFDGKNEILFYLYAGYAHMPRGWLLLDPETGVILQKAYFGGPPNVTEQCLARDFDNDGHLELVLGTNAPENHFELNGVSDVWVYVLAYDLVTGEREFSKIMGPFYGGAKILGPGPTPDTWITSYHGMGGSVRPSRSRLSLFRWKSTVPVRELPFTSRFLAYRGPDYDGDGADDIYCLLVDKMEFWVVSDKLSVLAKASLKNPPQGSLPGTFFEIKIVDVDLDGQKEIILNLGESLYILNKDLKPLAAIRTPKQSFRGIFNRGAGEPSFLVTEDWLELGDRKVHLWQLEPTPVLARYAPS